MITGHIWRTHHTTNASLDSIFPKFDVIKRRTIRRVCFFGFPCKTSNPLQYFSEYAVQTEEPPCNWKSTDITDVKICSDFVAVMQQLTIGFSFYSLTAV